MILIFYLQFFHTIMEYLKEVGNRLGRFLKTIVVPSNRVILCPKCGCDFVIASDNYSMSVVEENRTRSLCVRCPECRRKARFANAKYRKAKKLKDHGITNTKRILANTKRILCEVIEENEKLSMIAKHIKRIMG